MSHTGAGMVHVPKNHDAAMGHSPHGNREFGSNDTVVGSLVTSQLPLGVDWDAVDVDAGNVGLVPVTLTPRPASCAARNTGTRHRRKGFVRRQADAHQSTVPGIVVEVDQVIACSRARRQPGHCSVIQLVADDAQHVQGQ